MNAMIDTGDAAAVPLALRLLLFLLMAGAGMLLARVGLRGRREQLRRNPWAGVRTTLTMSSDDAFRVANRVAAPLTIAGGAVSVLTAVAILWTSDPGVMAGTLGAGGLLTGALVLLGGVRGHRAAQRQAGR